MNSSEKTLISGRSNPQASRMSTTSVEATALLISCWIAKSGLDAPALVVPAPILSSADRTATKKATSSALALAWGLPDASLKALTKAAMASRKRLSTSLFSASVAVLVLTESPERQAGYPGALLGFRRGLRYNRTHGIERGRHQGHRERPRSLPPRQCRSALDLFWNSAPAPF